MVPSGGDWYAARAIDTAVPWTSNDARFPFKDSAMPTPINIGRPIIQADKTTRLQDEVSAQAAKDKLVEIAGNLIKKDGSIKSGYLRLHASRDSGHSLSRGGGHFRTGYSAAGSLIRELVERAYGPDSPAAKSLDAYQSRGSKITTRGLVKLIATLEGEASELSARLKGKALPKSRLDIDGQIRDAGQKQEILNDKVINARLVRSDPIVDLGLKEQKWFYVNFPSAEFPDSGQATLALDQYLENLDALRSEVIHRLEQYDQAISAGGLDPEAANLAAHGQPGAQAGGGSDVGPVGRSLLRLLRDVEVHRQKLLSGYLDELETLVKSEVNGSQTESALSIANVDGKLKANEAYGRALMHASAVLAQDLAQTDPSGGEGLTRRIYGLGRQEGGPEFTLGMRRESNLRTVQALEDARAAHRAQMLPVAVDALEDSHSDLLYAAQTIARSENPAEKRKIAADRHKQLQTFLDQATQFDSKHGLDNPEVFSKFSVLGDRTAHLRLWDKLVMLQRKVDEVLPAQPGAQGIEPSRARALTDTLFPLLGELESHKSAVAGLPDPGDPQALQAISELEARIDRVYAKAGLLRPVIEEDSAEDSESDGSSRSSGV
jgi:hypothetical protein